MQRLMSSLKYLVIGAFVWIIGSVFVGSSQGFLERSEPTRLIVLEMESKRDSEGDTTYRPVLAREAEEPPRTRYVGNHWSSPAPHAAGDVVPGRYDPETGEMRTDKMTGRSMLAGRIARWVGLAVALQGILVLGGVPERFMPLKFRTGHRRRHRWLFNP